MLYIWILCIWYQWASLCFCISLFVGAAAMCNLSGFVWTLLMMECWRSWCYRLSVVCFCCCWLLSVSCLSSFCLLVVSCWLSVVRCLSLLLSVVFLLSLLLLVVTVAAVFFACFWLFVLLVVACCLLFDLLLLVLVLSCSCCCCCFFSWCHFHPPTVLATWPSKTSSVSVGASLTGRRNLVQAFNLAERKWIQNLDLLFRHLENKPNHPSSWW